MIYLNKLLHKIKENPTIFKSPEIILILGLTPTQIKDLKKFALEKSFLEQRKQEFFLTNLGAEYLNKNPLASWATSEYPNRPEINVEYLKLEKAPAVLTKAMRNLAKHLINGEELKAFSLEKALFEDLANNFFKPLLDNFSTFSDNSLKPIIKAPKLVNNIIIPAIIVVSID